ncbi:putative U2 small nuclear ribonucleoprotein B'' [Ceratocystis fimbriata CBS 114723]|uniref:Putative U2 small nuclear ribonucleoprotein B n=1 Tax=Ceratocystis fimbriata CBS 114723 TaxID=1035309 RepID=A0A2C5WXD0_9PEZI|nr:putative U2 small nuclear ribonucleoprotein B'' [Ceratocystis fimbriata CBS 114723]
MAPVAPAKPAGNAAIPVKVVPNQTLYVTNIPSAKITKPDLRTELYLLFSTYGAVLDVVALKTQKMRGQAHIVYRDIQTATQAMRALQGSEFLGLELMLTRSSLHRQKIQYAKSKSNFISKLDGTFKMPGSTQGAAEVAVTELQASIFNAPAPGSKQAITESKPAHTNSGTATTPGPDTTMRETTPADARGQKRTRNEESEASDDSDVAMEEDSDDD